MNDLTKIFDELKLDQTNNLFIMAGDMNARHTDWGDLTVNMRGQYLQWWLKNDFKYKTHMWGPAESTFPAANTFLDMGLFDIRVKVTNAINNKIRVIPYDSDHKALLFTIELEMDDNLLYEKPVPQNRLTFNKTYWEKFHNDLEKQNDSQEIPANRNLTKNEIDYYLNYYEKIIYQELVNNTPKNKNYSTLTNYIDTKIKKLQKIKNNVLTIKHNISKNRKVILFRIVNNCLVNSVPILEFSKEKKRKLLAVSIISFFLL